MLTKPARSKPGLKHGMSHTPIYHVWHTMKARCHSPKAAAYQHYGARGIKVCERWMTFENFLADMGVCPEGCSLDRINTDGDYGPDNCRWLPKAENLGRSNAENPRKRPTQRPQVAEPLILPTRQKLPNVKGSLTTAEAAEVFTVSEIAKMVKADPATIRKLLNDGVLGGFRVGTDWRIPKVEVDAFIQRFSNRPLLNA